MPTLTQDLQATFRDAMAHMCAPVSVVTTMQGGRPHGTTVSALMSLSVDPLLIAVSLAETSSTLEQILQSGGFGVNILSAQQAHLAMAFATKSGDKFADSLWTVRGSGVQLEDTSAWLNCTVDSVITGGDHKIVVGAVSEVHVDSDRAPLTYQGRTFGTHLSQPEA